MDATRINLVIGKDNFDKLKSSYVAIIGLGGVGSYIAETLARSGVGHLLLIDGDCVEKSNLNRQILALNSTLGMFKAEVMKNRIKDINPDCKVDVINRVYNPGDFDLFFNNQINFIADAIDSVNAKIDIIKNAKERNIEIISAMGTGNKLNPLDLEISDISKTHTCPLARVVRTKLKKDGITKGVKVVFSKEIPKKNDSETVGSLVFVPATAGIIIASEILKKIINY
jgi:tRNA A37 threonylcarbamoyladenosine dehydratase